uniref:Uncharacterized protein n=1 Tax=Daphnia galeata TaxID=27404 RepID=A0A8J2RXM3_9CRUS|nr:unnamed protein product [Daphnia galeata]
MDEDYMESENNSSDICKGGVLETLQTALIQANDNFICSLPKSTHQLAYDLYALLTLTDAKGYAMMQFSWMILRLYGRGNNANETEQARIDFEKRMTEKAAAAQKIENETYIQFNELLQGYVVNEVDLNQDNTCKDSCSAYTNTQEKGCFGNQFCAHSRRCSSGRIYNCGFVEADSNICINNEPGRRYDWIQYKSGRVFGGQKSECKRTSQQELQSRFMVALGLLALFLLYPEGTRHHWIAFPKLGGHLNLEAQASPIDFTTGTIDNERAIWVSNDNTPASEIKPRTKLSLLSPDVSTRSRIPSVPDSTSDQFIEFQVSSLEKDVSQNTVPFIEATPVFSQPPTWLTGIGIYHKGQPGYGGYVAFPHRYSQLFILHDVAIKKNSIIPPKKALLIKRLNIPFNF